MCINNIENNYNRVLMFGMSSFNVFEQNIIKEKLLRKKCFKCITSNNKNVYNTRVKNSVQICIKCDF